MMHSVTKKAHALLEEIQREHSLEVIQRLADLIKKDLPRKKGRRVGTGDKEDLVRVDRLVELLRAGVNEDEAVKQVAREDPGSNETNTRRRMRRNLPEAQARLENLDPEKEEILRRMFANPSEPWDL